ncbi:MAG: hypothetical protein IJW63_02290 [Lachnospiraceae bacterium]|nr:hypothetical protein [Lachnospiraceae bacterium]
MKKLTTLLLVAALAIGTLTGCGGSGGETNNVEKPVQSSEVVTPSSSEVVEDVVAPKEAPMLTALVEAGTLPALDERMPVEADRFVETVDATGAPLSIGTYGGTINLANGGGSWDLSRPITESIIHYNTDGSYYPNVIKSFEHNDDYTEWTFHLREGMKWSDGDDFNADDITFWFYMCHVSNFDTKKSWAALVDYKEKVVQEDGTEKDVIHHPTLTKVDDLTVKFTFTKAKLPADFIENGDFKWCWAPSHYLNDLIPDSIYVENEYWPATGLSDEQVLLNAKAKGIDQATIKDLGKAVSYYFWNVSGVPTLNPYVLTTKEGNNTKDAELCILERNPYYWKVDAEGNQLPYCDAIYFHKYSETGQDQLAFRSKELDVINVGMGDIATILADMGEDAQLRVMSGSNWGSYQITFNYTIEDKNYADLFANIKFREAMSIAVDREQVSGLLTDGFLAPAQCAPAKGNFGYDEEWEKKWTNYDVAAAKKLLEECGLVMGADGFYDFADGSDLLITFYSYTESLNSETSYPVLEQYFKAIGINCANKDLAVEAFDQEIDNNTWCAVLGPHTSIGGLSLRDRVAPFVPVQEAAEWYGEYGAWYGTGGAEGVEPTGDMAELLKIYEQWAAEKDSAKRDELSLKIYDIHKANLWSIAYLEGEGTYTLISSKLGNYPKDLVSADLYQYANIAHYWTMYKTE